MIVRNNGIEAILIAEAMASGNIEINTCDMGVLLTIGLKKSPNIA